MEHAFQKALDMEEYLQMPTAKKSFFQPGGTATKRLIDSSKGFRTAPQPIQKLNQSHVKKPISDTLKKLIDWSTCTYQCPTKSNLHHGKELEEEPNQQWDVEDEEERKKHSC